MRLAATYAVAATALASGITAAWWSDQSPADNAADRVTQSRVAFSATLPAMDGNHLKVILVEVNYGPDAASAPHTHPCPVVGYVLQGEIASQVRGHEGSRFKPGEGFYETPNGVHQVSANASRDTPAQLLAIFVCDQDKPLSPPVSAEP